MQPLNEIIDENQKKLNRRGKPFSRYPKQMPSYIVAFAVHETYDDIATAQQMICNKRSLQSSISSVSPAISTKTLTIDCNSAPKIPDGTEFNKTPDESKTKVNEERSNDDENNDIQNELSEIADDIIVANKGEDDVKQQDIGNIKPKQIKRQVNRLSRNKRQNHSRIKNVNFKYKKSIKKEEKANRKLACAAQIKETFYSNSTSKVVSRTSLLKSVVPTEILDTVDSVFSDEGDNNNESLQSSPSTTKNSFISYSSEDTLTLQGSTSSKNEDLNSLGTINSVIKIPSQRAMPYKTDVINVSVAVAYNPTGNDNERNLSSAPCRSIFGRDLVSSETLVEPVNLLTSDSVSSEYSDNANVQNIYRQAVNMNNMSDGTLKPNSESTYVVGNTSSEADDSLQSESTLIPDSETFMYAETLRQTPPSIEKPEKENNYNRIAILDTVINMGIFPEINPSTSSALNFKDDINSIFVTGDSGKYLKSPIYIGDKTSESQNDSSKYEVFKTLQKSFEESKDVNPLKKINLPNESTIKAIIDETDKIESKFWSEGLGNINSPGNIADLWDRLVLVVDTAVKRLENSLTEKIINEIRNQLPSFEKPPTQIKEEIFVVDVDNARGDIEQLNKEVSVYKIKTEEDESVQCTLVGNKAIDNIMLKISVEDPKLESPRTKSYPKMKRPKIFRDYFEVLKPPTVESALVEEKGGTVTVSTTTPSEVEVVGSFNRIKAIFSGPFTFLRENMLVVTSVPTFFVMLLCVYGLIIFIMKPW